MPGIEHKPVEQNNRQYRNGRKTRNRYDDSWSVPASTSVSSSKLKTKHNTAGSRQGKLNHEGPQNKPQSKSAFETEAPTGGLSALTVEEKLKRFSNARRATNKYVDFHGRNSQSKSNIHQKLPDGSENRSELKRKAQAQKGRLFRKKNRGNMSSLHSETILKPRTRDKSSSVNNLPHTERKAVNIHRKLKEDTKSEQRRPHQPPSSSPEMLNNKNISLKDKNASKNTSVQMLSEMNKSSEFLHAEIEKQNNRQKKHNGTRYRGSSSVKKLKTVDTTQNSISPSAELIADEPVRRRSDANENRLVRPAAADKWVNYVKNSHCFT